MWDGEGRWTTRWAVGAAFGALALLAVVGCGAKADVATGATGPSATAQTVRNPMGIPCSEYLASPDQARHDAVPGYANQLDLSAADPALPATVDSACQSDPTQPVGAVVKSVVCTQRASASTSTVSPDAGGGAVAPTSAPGKSRLDPVGIHPYRAGGGKGGGKSSGGGSSGGGSGGGSSSGGSSSGHSSSGGSSSGGSSSGGSSSSGSSGGSGSSGSSDPCR